jgi:phage-related protein
MSETDELKARVQAKRKELEAKLHQLKADSRGDAEEAQRSIERKLTELERLVSDGWDRMTESTARKVNEWLR